MLSACGITEYWSTVPGAAAAATENTATETSSPAAATSFCATLKEVPSDFVVVEVDPDGQRTDASDYRFAPPTASPREPAHSAGAATVAATAGAGLTSSVADGRHPDQKQEGSALSEAAKTTEDDTSSSTDAVFAWLEANMESVVRTFGTEAEVGERLFGLAFGADSGAELTTFLNDARDYTTQNHRVSASGEASGAPAAAADDSRWWLRRVPLGREFGKGQRRVLHFLVKHVFPHLRMSSFVVAAPPADDKSGDGGKHGSNNNNNSNNNNSGAARAPPPQEVFLSYDLQYLLFLFLFFPSPNDNQLHSGGSEAAQCVEQGRRVTSFLYGALVDANRRHLSDDEWSAMEGARAAAAAARGVVGPDLYASASSSSASASAAPASIALTFREPLVVGAASPLTSSAAAAAPVTPAPCVSDKEIKRAFHEVLRRFFPFIRCYVTNGRAQLKYVRSGGAAGGKTTGRRGDKRPRDGGGGDGASCAANTSASPQVYTYFIVKKVNLDTAEMKALLARLLNDAGRRTHTGRAAAVTAATTTTTTTPLDHHSVGIAGMKDKVAVTYQRVSAPGDWRALDSGTGDSSNTPPLTLGWPGDEARSYLQVVRVSPHLYSRPLELGCLWGNHFTIRLRRLRPAEADSQRAPDAATTAESLFAALQRQLRRVCACGFANYYGQQRFSQTVRAARDHTGVHLLRAARAAATAAERDASHVAAVRSIFRSGAGGGQDDLESLYAGLPGLLEGRAAAQALQQRRVCSRDAAAVLKALQTAARQLGLSIDPAEPAARGGAGEEEVAAAAASLRRDTERKVLTWDGVHRYELLYSSASAAQPGAAGDGSSSSSSHPCHHPQQQQHPDGLLRGLWPRVCEAALRLHTPFFLKSLWVHAGQSAAFNLMTSAVIRAARRHLESLQTTSGESSQRECARSLELLRRARLSLGSDLSSVVLADRATDAHNSDDEAVDADDDEGGGSAEGQVEQGEGSGNNKNHWPSSSARPPPHTRVRTEDAPNEKSSSEITGASEEESHLAALIDEARRAAEEQLGFRLSSGGDTESPIGSGGGCCVVADNTKVVGVPVSAQHRRMVAFPTDASVRLLSATDASATAGTATSEIDVEVCFRLPRGTYATVFLREVLLHDEWW